MKNEIQINRKYLVSGRYVKVTAITPTHIQVVWGHNGSTPVRQCDRMFPIRMARYFRPV